MYKSNLIHVAINIKFVSFFNSRVSFAGCIASLSYPRLVGNVVASRGPFFQSSVLSDRADRKQLETWCCHFCYNHVFRMTYLANMVAISFSFSSFHTSFSSLLHASFFFPLFLHVCFFSIFFTLQTFSLFFIRFFLPLPLFMLFPLFLMLPFYLSFQASFFFPLFLSASFFSSLSPCFFISLNVSFFFRKYFFFSSSFSRFLFSF